MLFRTYRPRYRKQGFLLPAEVVRSFGSTAALAELPPYAFPWLAMFPGDLWGNARRHMERIGVKDPTDWLMSLHCLLNAQIFDISQSVRLTLDYRQDDSLGAAEGADLALVAAGNRVHIMTAERWRHIATKPQSEEALMLAAGLSAYSTTCGVSENEAEQVQRAYFDKFQEGARELEIAVAEALNASGAAVVELTQPSQDGGIDSIAYIRRENHTEVLYVQVKGGGKKITVREVRELLGVVARDGATAGLLVACGEFSSYARKEARLSKIRIDLVNMQRLATWVQQWAQDPVATRNAA
jgi:hypothetical protein